MRDIIVIGGGGHAKVVVSILEKLPEVRIVGYTDLQDRGESLGIPYLGLDSSLGRYPDVDVVLAVGQLGLGHRRAEIWNGLKGMSRGFPAIQSPRSIVNEGVRLEDGVVVMDHVVINPDASVGCGAIINTGSIVEHDVTLGDWVHVAPGAVISGGVKVGAYSMIGTGAVVIEGRSIAADCVVGAGAVVVRDVSEPGIYAGCPARRIR